MNMKQELFGLATVLLGCSAAFAGTMGVVDAPKSGLRPMISLQGGYASMNAGKKFQSFTGVDSDIFTYTNTGSGRNTGFVGAFLGAEYVLPWITYPGIFMQTGVEYNYFGQIGLRGINTVGVEPATSTTYRYRYNFQTQQVLGLVKLLATCHERFYPYAEVGLGAAFNHNGKYNAVTSETGSINLTPTFNNQDNTQFSYNLGVGVDTQVNNNIRVGLGYRYSNFGSSSFGKGFVSFNTYQAPVSFSIGSSHAYANQLLARISYLA